MADDSGYVVVRNAVSLAQIQPVLTAMEKGLTALVERDKYTEYQVPVTADAIRSEFLKVWCPFLEDNANLFSEQPVRPGTFLFAEGHPPSAEIY
jgi:hypothetical protein